MSEKQFFPPPYERYVGQTLGTYTLLRLSAQPASGPVFLARHTEAATYHRLRFLALPASLSAEQRLLCLDHFQREAGQVALLHHPALLPLNDYGISRGVPYLVVPDLPLSARPLQALLTAEGPADPGRVRTLLEEIAAALEYAHQRGVLHLNLNTHTILLHSDGQALITETGLLRMFSVTGTLAGEQATLENGSPLLLDGQGRPLYALSLASAPAPELLRGQSPGTSTDVYALGALLYHLLTGHQVWHARTLQDLVMQHLHAPLPPLRKWRRGLPDELDQVIGLAMTRDLSQRLRTPQALARTYAAIIPPGAGVRRSPGSAAPRGTVLQETLTPPLPYRRQPVSRRRALVLLAGGGVAATGAAAWLIESKHLPGPVAGGGSSAGNPGGTVLARTQDVPANSASSFPLPDSPNPGVLVHLRSGQFVAFHSTCTHAGCAVRYNGQNQLLECPCHGAAFDPARQARVVKGPAPSPLTPIPITVQADGTIIRKKSAQ
jgi:Rieske Fe-S protein